MEVFKDARRFECPDRYPGSLDLARRLEAAGYVVAYLDGGPEALDDLIGAGPDVLVLQGSGSGASGGSVAAAPDPIELVCRLRAACGAPILVLSSVETPARAGADRLVSGMTAAEARSLARTERREQLGRLLVDCRGNIAEMARRLGKDRSTVRYHLKRLGMLAPRGSDRGRSLNGAG